MESRHEHDWFQLEEYVEKLLREGKRSQHEDFQVLFRIFEEKRIREMAKKVLERLRTEK